MDIILCKPLYKSCYPVFKAFILLNTEKKENYTEGHRDKNKLGRGYK